MFAKPDYFLQAAALSCPCKGRLICPTNGFAWDHGDYAAEINTNYVGFVGPGVKNLGLDGPAADVGHDLVWREQRPDRGGRRSLPRPVGG